MASAVLSGRNDQCWREREVYMRNFPNNPANNPAFNSRFDLNPNPNWFPRPAQSLTPNSSFIKQRYDIIPKNNLRTENEPPLMPPPPPAPVAPNHLYSFHRKHEGHAVPKDQFHREYVTFNLSLYSGRELKELKSRLISDLQRVRSLLTRIQNWTPDSKSGCHDIQVRPPSTEVRCEYTMASQTEKPTAKSSQQKRAFVNGAKKNKKISGQKRVNPFGSGQNKKRPAVVETAAERVAGTMMRKCKLILTKLMKHKFSWVFNKPVDVEGLGLHDYFQIIKHPMDLGTVKLRLNKNSYQTPLDFASDVRLTFQNAMKYNPKGQDVHTFAETLLLSFEKMFFPEYERYEAEHLKPIPEEPVKPNSWAQTQSLKPPRAVPEVMQRVGESKVMPLETIILDTPPVEVAAVPNHSSSEGGMSLPVPKSGRLPKPKGKCFNKRPMTIKEKAMLGLHLQNIRPDEMEKVAEIVRKRNTLLPAEEDEIEIDIETLDNETLWELDRLVDDHKKAVNMTKRQEIEKAALAEPVTKPLVSDAAPELSLQINKKGEAGEEDVDIGEEIPVNKFPPVEIEKDTACASGRSSSSGSSSSSSNDSSSSCDSESSSGSDSDEVTAHSPGIKLEPKQISTA